MDNLTLPSLTIAIFRSNFMEMENIPIITGRTYKNIRASYIGGIVDVYKPRGTNVYTYDVNSLYPYVMTKSMPIGKPVLSTETNLDNIFGFVLATVTTTKNLYIPTLPFRSKNGRIINPNGS